MPWDALIRREGGDDGWLADVDAEVRRDGDDVLLSAEAPLDVPSEGWDVRVTSSEGSRVCDADDLILWTRLSLLDPEAP